MAESQIPGKPQMSKPESSAVVEKDGEKKVEVVKEVKKPVEKGSSTPVVVAPVVQEAQVTDQASPHPKIQKSETLEKIEDIMEEDLGEMYTNLSPEVKEEFREKGEEAAVEIEGMLFKVKDHSKRIFKLLFGWMKVIPGINKFFLKQEAKIKTDEILHLKDDVDKSRRVT